MQFFDRTNVPPPELFRSPAAVSERKELVDYMRQSPERLAQTEPPAKLLSLSDDTVLLGLDKLFRSKCAFCESKAPLNVHLFRPPEEAVPLARSDFAHLYYVWLRTDWRNVYAICSKCAGSARRSFPVRDSNRGELPKLDELEHFANENYGLWRWPHSDKPLLLDPCDVKDFTPHLSVDLSGGIQPRSRRGEETISVFSLDRSELIEARTETYQRYLDLLRSELENASISSALDFSRMEFGGAWYLLLRRLVERIGQRIELKLDRTKDQLQRSLERVYRTPLGREAFADALDDIRMPLATRASGGQRSSRHESTRRMASVRVENFKALQKVTLDLPQAILEDPAGGAEAEAAALLVLGENAAGKSSILEAIALALCGEKVRSRLGKSSTAFVLDPELMGCPDQRPPEEASVCLCFTDGSELRVAIGNGFVENGDLEGLPPVFGYGAFRQYAGGVARAKRAGNVSTLFHSDIVLPNPEAWLLGLPDPQFSMVMRALRRIFSVENEFDVVQRDQVNERCLIVTMVGDGDEAREIKTPLSVASSGFRSVLAMVCDVFKRLLAARSRGELVSFDEAEAVILIDEVEAHLHPRWKMQIMGALRRVLPKAIFVVTTHDPLCLRGMHDREVVVFNRVRKLVRDETNEMPVVVETVVELPNVENLTIEQLLTSDLFAMFSTDSPEAERKLAQLGSLLARRVAGDRLEPTERDVLHELEQQVVQALPLGSSEVQRLVLKAVAEYMQRRRGSSAMRIEELEGETRRLIIEALEGY
ncbi:ATP-binding protein [Paraburkholderia aspalathi]|nr:AAA family ATPase [Paraburkholderia nemoris]MBK3813360.1 ATP-binding protein [Paraburkholderia aspalathi]